MNRALKLTAICLFTSFSAVMAARGRIILSVLLFVMSLLLAFSYVDEYHDKPKGLR